MASCTGVTDGAALFVSKDRGATWSLLVENVTALNGIRNYYNLFVFEGALYMMGAGAGNQNLLISRSEDNGRDLDRPTDATNGVLLTGGFHSAAVPVVVYDGRLWRPAKRPEATPPSNVRSSFPHPSMPTYSTRRVGRNPTT